MEIDIKEITLSDGSKSYDVCISDGFTKVYLPAVNKTYAHFFVGEFEIIKKKYLLD